MIRKSYNCFESQLITSLAEGSITMPIAISNFLLNVYSKQKPE
jgi:hypothetical protein